MLKALIKKQFLELNTFYFQNKKTGKMRSKAGIAGTIILFLWLFALLGIVFGGLGIMLAGSLSALNFDWLYFCMMGLIAILLGTFGSVFNTYAGLYHAKDNDLLLSMPIPPSKILFARMTGVYGISLLYTALVWVPAIIAYFIEATPTPLCVIFSILQLFIITLFVTVLTCALGWVVALISSKLKNKSFVTVLASLVFLGLYYVVYFRINEFLQSLVKNADLVGEKVKSFFYPFYLMGLSATGKVLPMVIVTAIVAVLFALTYYILSRSFIKITTTKTAEKKAEYQSRQVKSNSIGKALFKKELARFTKSSTYMLNCGIGLIIMVAFSAFAIIKASAVREFISEFSVDMPELPTLIPIFAVAIICMMISMNQISAPSISLEGKNIWILQSLPVDTKEILNAKLNLHTALNAPVAALTAVALGYVVEADFSTIVYMVVAAIAYSLLSASIGLSLNLKNPNLDWTNETVPVKQSAAVAIGIFGGWAISLIIGVVAFVLRNKFDLSYYIFICALVMLLAARFLNKWINTKGAEIFKSL